MEYLFREEVRKAKKAAMGEMVNLAWENLKEGERLINFASGHPPLELFPDRLLMKYMQAAIETSGKELLQYGAHAGFTPLRKSLMEFLNRQGDIVGLEDDLIITYGATEAIYLAATALIGPGDRVIVEVPSYVNAIMAFRLSGGNVVGVCQEEDGVNLCELEVAMKQGAKLFYTVPNFGNPSGVTMCEQKREAVYELAVKYGVPILEDSTYGNLRYHGRRLPDIKEYDREGAVIYVGSVSKTIAPALRVGYMAAERDFINKIIPIKAISSNGVTNIIQHALWRMYEETDIYGRIREICDLYAKKLQTMVEGMDRYFPDSVRYTCPEGGMYVWVTMPEGTDIMEFCRESAAKLHVPVTPGSGFCVREPENCRGLRFNFVKESKEDIVYGIEKVGRLMEQYIR